MNLLNYQKRAVSFLGTQTIGQTQLKMYYLTSEKQKETPTPNAELRRQWLTQGLDEVHFPGEHHIGFAIIHAADDGYYLLISTWCDANMLRHQVFIISDENRLQPLDNTKIIACVWELAVMFYERNYWIEQVMTTEKLEEANIQRYLQKGYSGWV
ncbi:hypothetical protein [Xenorhabdus taiwanensis]|uniref:Uncharacterized protein n=1 Tax=Xenorhabdus taiwanensis TaxID=3085177 RepID=A0ABN7C8J9_9GAMM|nr:hypothetical protein TCT1_37970 [Xenorhabdus sp. TCT-1]